jgi:flagellar hook-associated protein 1
LNNLYQSFSSWGQSTYNDTVRQAVIDRASELATAFRQTATAVANAAHDTETQLTQTTDRVNDLTSQIRDLNGLLFQGDRKDSGVDAQIHERLENLAQYVDITARQEEDGSMTVLLNGQTPLVIGDHQYPIDYRLEEPSEPAPTFPGAPPLARLYSADGTDITSQTTGGQLGALLNVRNEIVPSYLGDAYQPGDLNRLAQQFATSVNDLLTGGYITDDGVDPEPGIALFQFDATDITHLAQNLQVDAAVGPEDLAAISPGPPYLSNGVPLALSALYGERKMAGTTFSSYLGQIAGRVGSRQAAAEEDLTTQQSLLSQSKSMRQDVSGVSLDEEATTLIQFQRAYQANSRLISVLNQLTEETINMLQR